jgi:hypothetical protein
MKRTWEFKTLDYTMKASVGEHNRVAVITEYDTPDRYTRVEIHLTAKQAREIGAMLNAASKALGEKE